MTARPNLRPPFDTLEPKEVLYFYDEPIIFTAEDRGGLFLCLRTSADDTPEFLVSVTDSVSVTRIQSGTLSLRSAFVRSLAWHVTTSEDYAVQDAEWLERGTIPDDLLPEEGAGLYPHHKTIVDEYNAASLNKVLNVSFRGGTLTSGTMPLGTLKSLVDEVYTSLRQVFAPVVADLFQEPISESSIGRILQIPVYQPEFASLSLSFALPSLDVSGLKKAVSLDTEAWSKEAREATSKFMASAEQINRLASDGSISNDFAYGASVALEVLSKISPSSTTPFETLEISGDAGTGKNRKIVIDVVRGERITAAYNMAKRGQQTLSGKIVETNGRSGTIIVRREGGKETTCILTKRLMASEPTEIRNYAEVTVSGSLVSRPRRDQMTVRKIVLSSGRTFARHEGEGAFVAE